MTQKDYWTDTIRRKEKADEDRYFAEQDRKLIEKLQATNLGSVDILCIVKNSSINQVVKDVKHKTTRLAMG